MSAEITAVNAMVAYIQLHSHSPFSEPLAYSLFVGTFCLITALSKSSDKTQRNSLRGKLQESFVPMSRVACPLYGGTLVYLEYLQMRFLNFL